MHRKYRNFDQRANLHDYFDIDIKILWETIETDIPKLKQSISVYLGNI